MGQVQGAGPPPEDRAGAGGLAHPPEDGAGAGGLGIFEAGVVPVGAGGSPEY